MDNIRDTTENLIVFIQLVLMEEKLITKQHMMELMLGITENGSQNPIVAEDKNMCGIGGYAVFVDSKNYLHTDGALKRFVTDLVSMNTIRGADSTGIYGYDLSKLEYFLDKKLMPGHKYSNEISRLPKSMSGYHLVMTHNRKATVGGITLPTAHPLKYNNVVLTHNGTMGGYHSLKEKAVEVKLRSHISSDSMLLTYMLGQYTLDSFINEFWGAYAITYHYVNDPFKLYIARNEERTLYTSYIKYSDNKAKYDAITWASEAGMLSWLLDRHGIEHTRPKEVEPHTLFIHDLKNRKVNKKEIPKIQTAAPVKHYPNNNMREIGNYNVRRGRNFNDPVIGGMPRGHSKTEDGVGVAASTHIHANYLTPFSNGQKVVVSVCDVEVDDNDTFIILGEIMYPVYYNVARYFKIPIPANESRGLEWEYYALIGEICITKIQKRLLWLPNKWSGVYDVNNTFFGDRDFFYRVDTDEVDPGVDKLKRILKDRNNREEVYEFLINNYSSKNNDVEVVREHRDDVILRCDICEEPILNKKEMDVLEIDGEECLYKPIHRKCGETVTQEKESVGTVH